MVESVIGFHLSQVNGLTFYLMAERSNSLTPASHLGGSNLTHNHVITHVASTGLSVAKVCASDRGTQRLRNKKTKAT